jgi:competence protein ComEC
MIAPRILLAVVFGFLAGVAARSLLPVGITFVWFVGVIALASLFYILIDRDKSHTLIIIAIASVSFSVGILRMDAARIIGDATLSAHLNQRVIIDGSIVAEPDVRDGSVRLTVDTRSMTVGSTTMPVDARVLVVTPAHSEVRYGDEVRVEGMLSIPQSFAGDTGRTFDYQGYLGVFGVGYEIKKAHVTTIGANHGNPLYASVIDLKHAYLGGLAATLPEPQSGLGGGITVGDKRSIGPQLTEEFQRVSLVHVLVLSGYNITIVANAISRALSFAPSSTRFGSGLLVILFFVLSAGGASSALRAGLMAVIGMYGMHRKRSVHALRALGVVAFAMVVWNPFVLVFDPGFQLSVLATLGLLLATPIVARHLSWITERFGMREIVASTIGVQVFLMPYLLYQNGMLSMYALPANILALVAVPSAMFASFIAAISGMMVGAYATPIALPSYVLLSYIIEVAHFFAQLPFSGLTLGVFSGWWVLVIYILIGGVLIYENHRAQTAR